MSRPKRGAATLAAMYEDALEVLGEQVDLDEDVTAALVLNEDGRPVLVIDPGGCNPNVELSIQATFRLLTYLKLNEPDIFALAQGDQNAGNPHYAPDGARTESGTAL